MPFRGVVLKYWTLGLVLALSAAIPAAIRGEEPARDFLEKLRERRYYDMALEYLTQMESSPLATAEFKDIIPYERGVTLVQQAGGTRDLTERARVLDRAQQTLEEFVKRNTGHQLASSARSQLGNVIVERARMLVEQANERGASNSAQKLKDAAALYDEANQVFENSRQSIAEQLKGIPKVLDMKDKKQAAQADLRDQLRKDYLQTRLLAAAVREEKADTAKEGSEEHKAMLLEAAKAYEVIYEDYRTYVAGLYARMYQGRCYQKMKDFKEALSYYSDLLEQPDQPDAFRAVKTKTLLLAMDCWLDPAQKKFVEAITQGSSWLDKARPNETTDPEWLTLRLLVAKAHKLHAESLEDKDKQKGDSYKEAGRLAQIVSRQDSQVDLKKQAEEFLASLPNYRGSSSGSDEEIDPRDFNEAKTAGNEAREEMTSAQTVITLVGPKVKSESESDAKVKEDLRKQLETAEANVTDKRDLALKYYRRALELADGDPDVTLDDLNIVRYFLCYLHFIREEYYDAAVIGEFVARKFPSHVGAKPCAKIAMACYVKLYNAASQEGEGPADRDFEADRLIAVCDYITTAWPEAPEAADALNTLIPFMINRGDLDRAQEYLAQIPDDSANRGDAELKTGQAMWSAYLSGMAELQKWRKPAEDGGEAPPQDVDLAAREKELEDLKQRAQKTLADGVSRMRQRDRVDQTLAAAVLSLAQIYVDTNQAEKAIGELEDPKIGALTLTKANHPATQRPGFAQEAYKTALRAYIGSLPTAANAAEVMDQAKGIMDDLKNEVMKDPDGRTKLVAIYVSLAHSVRRSIDLAANDEAKNALSGGFETFLRQIGRESNDVNTLNWVAVTFQNLGEAFDNGRTPPPPKALNYYKEAVSTYAAMIKKDQANDAFLEDKIAIHVMVELAKLKRRLGEFEDSLKLFATVLKDNPTMITIQIEAALTYQERGRVDNPEYYKRAIVGGFPDEKKQNIIWGWGRLGTVVQRYPQYMNYFFEARYQAAKALYEYGRAANKPAEVQKARQYLVITHKLYPNLGAPDAPEWRPKYNELLAEIQKQLGEKPPYGLPQEQQKAEKTAKRD
jgi:tetratricopeptide (TPR) repeat protein